MSNKKVSTNTNWKEKLIPKNVFPYILIAFGIIGLLASSILVIEKITLLKEPATDLSCNLNPVYSCSNVISSKQAEIFGFPNELMGIAMFAALITLGVIAATKVELPKWLWKLFILGMLGGMGFVFWFFYQSVYVIGSLCIFCTSIWFSIWTITVAGYTWLYDEGLVHPKKSRSLKKIARLARSNFMIVWLMFIVTIAVLILHHFWYYYGEKLGF